MKRGRLRYLCVWIITLILCTSSVMAEAAGDITDVSSEQETEHENPGEEEEVTDEKESEQELENNTEAAKEDEIENAIMETADENKAENEEESAATSISAAALSIENENFGGYEWKFAAFGTSTSLTKNTYEGSLTTGLKLVATDNGGKFTNDGYDGISYYYTVLPKDVNFELTATFTIDALPESIGGQEGFAILARDSVGEHGNTASSFSNSAAAIASRIEYTDDKLGAITLKDGLGARFLTGLTTVNNPETGQLVKQIRPLDNYFTSKDGFVSGKNYLNVGDVYTMTLKKTNTGYHTIYTNQDGETTEQILYGVDKLFQIDEDYLYVGLTVARNCSVTITNVSFTTTNAADDAEAVPEPLKQTALTYEVTSPKTSSEKDYNLVFKANADGKLVVTDADGNILGGNDSVKANTNAVVVIGLVSGNNNLNVSFTPDEGYKPDETTELSSYETVSLVHKVDYKSYGTTEESIVVSPSGTVGGEGTKESPLDIYTAVKYIQPGQTLLLLAGRYEMNEQLVIARGIDGTEENRIQMISDPDSEERAVLDFNRTGKGMILWGNYWYIRGIDITNTPDNVKGFQVSGSNNIIDQVNTYSNGDTGLQISGLATETIKDWPSNNLILNCSSYDNWDSAAQNADGFAQKLTSGHGNVFDGCIAYRNVDDGWDLFAKVETGEIGAVTIRNCVAFENGTNLAGDREGDGNGFKLGGTNINGAHVLENCIAFNNLADGITSNSGPDITVKNCTSYNNGGVNIALYSGASQTAFVTDGILSFRESVSRTTYSNDNLKTSGSQLLSSLYSSTNYYYSNGSSNNVLGETVDSSWFVSLDTSIMPIRNADGTINMNGLLELTSLAPEGTGAYLSGAGTASYDIEVPPAIGTSYTVTFIDGENIIETQSVVRRNLVTEPEALTKNGYTFDGWYTEEGNKWDFAKDVITSDITLSAQFIEDKLPAPVPDPEPETETEIETGTKPETETEIETQTEAPADTNANGATTAIVTAGSNNTNKATPKTGDTNILIIYIFSLIVCSSAIGMIAITKRKQKR